MVWYYRDGEENKGPFNDEEIEQLVTDRTVRGDTWVWREGMEGWKKYEDVAAVDGSAKTVVMASVPTDCTKCGKNVGLTNLRPHAGKLVCEDCLAELKAAEAQASAAEARAEAPPAAQQAPPTPAAPAPPQPAAAPAPPPRPAAPAVPAVPATPAAPSVPSVPAPSASRGIAGAGAAGMHYASVMDRFLARLIDAGVIVGAMIVGTVFWFVFSLIPRVGFVLGCLTWLAVVLAALAYEVYFLANKDGATIGKRMRNLRVVRSDGSDLDMKQSIIRVLSSTFLGIGAIMALFDEEERKALHDMIADTRVVQA
jgi:uncharacterized RDD family membrane protein YckC